MQNEKLLTNTQLRRKFVQLYQDFFAYHQAVYWGGDYLTKTKRNARTQKTISLLQKAYQYNELVVPHVERFFNSRHIDHLTDTEFITNQKLKRQDRSILSVGKKKVILPTKRAWPIKKQFDARYKKTMQQYLLRSSFDVAWIREFTFASASLIGKNFSKYIGTILFQYEQGQLICYRQPRRIQLFSRRVGIKAIKGENYARHISQTLIRLSDELSDFFKKNRRLSIQNYKKFQDLYHRFLYYHMAVYWSGDYMNTHKKKSVNSLLLEHAWKYNEKVYQKIDSWIKYTTQEISKQSHLSQECLNTLTWEEILGYVKTKKLPQKEELLLRSAVCILAASPTSQDVVSGQYAKEISYQLSALTSQKGKKIHGTMIHPGVVQGTVQRIRVLEQLSRFSKGKILVTHMTRPQYNAALKQAKAIVTDEGGMLCHAAILAREYKIPCVVGTKNATQILKNGDRVEVDANKGVVKMIG